MLYISIISTYSNFKGSPQEPGLNNFLAADIKGLKICLWNLELNSGRGLCSQVLKFIFVLEYTHELISTLSERKKII